MAEQDDTKVGYRNPPRRTRFTRGQSGNPRGRPKGSRNVATVLTETITETVIVTENGRRRSITKLDAAAKQLADRAAAGDLKAIHQLMRLAQWVEGRTDALAAPEEPLNDDDRQVIAAIYARLISRDKGDGRG